MIAADIMTPAVLTVLPDTKLAHATRLMLDHRISGLPVIDAYGRLVGVITEGDLLRRVELGTDVKSMNWLLRLLSFGAQAVDYVHTHARSVGDLMTDTPITVQQSTPITEVVAIMEHKHIKRLPVLADGRLVGVVSRADVLRALSERLVPDARDAIDDEEVRVRVVSEFSDTPWTAQANITVEVDAGRVRLQGMIFDERLRAAIRVLAENVPGVIAVTDELVLIDPVSGTYFGVA